MASKKAPAKKAPAKKAAPAKKPSSKTRGIDESGNPVNLSSEKARQREVNRSSEALRTGNTKEWKASSRNVQDFARNRDLMRQIAPRVFPMSGPSSARGNAGISGGRGLRGFFGGGLNNRGK